MAKTAITIKNTIVTKITSKSLIATILPNKKLLKLAAPFTKSESTAASPIPKLIIIAVDISEFFGKYLLMISMEKLATAQEIIAVMIGFTLKISPIVTPARETCDSASPIIEFLLFTITTPMQGITMDNIIPTKKALLINSS